MQANFGSCLLSFAVGEGGRRENFVLYDGHCKCSRKENFCLTRWSEHVVRGNCCMALGFCC